MSGLRDLNRRVKRAPAFVALAVVAVALVAVGAWRDTGPTNNTERINAIAKTLKCPACVGESVYESRVAVAVNIREEIARRVAQGQTDGDVRAAIEQAFPGSELVPDAEGANLALWVLPAVALVLGLGSVALAFRRWRAQAGAAGEPDDDDRALVAAALRNEVERAP
jgi:cytochrome c-type biogenesis protein CcmH/NrfF